MSTKLHCKNTKCAHVQHTSGVLYGTVGVHTTTILMMCNIWHRGCAYHTNGVPYGTVGVLIPQIKM